MLGEFAWHSLTLDTTIGDVSAAYSDELAIAADSTRLVAHLNLMLAADQLDSGAVAQIINAISTIPSATAANLQTRVHAAILLVMAAPSYQVIK